MKAAVLGAGAWGTALATLLARQGQEVRLWCRRPALAERIAQVRGNPDYLPGIAVPERVAPTSDLEEAVGGAELVLVAVPVQHVRQVLAAARPALSPEAFRISAAKGFERMSLLRVSEILTEIWGQGPVGSLSGPSFALEVSRGEPTAVTLASQEEKMAARAQRLLAGDSFRVYTTPDLVGVEVAGALKNVVAIAAGMVRGLGLGANSLAALLTRGLAEMSRLGVALGARRETFVGLAGMGDLVATATGPLSRNARVGEAVARGHSLGGVLAGRHDVAEGVETALAAVALAARVGVDLPITSSVVEVLHQGQDPRRALRALMQRDLRAE